MKQPDMVAAARRRSNQVFQLRMFRSGGIAAARLRFARPKRFATAMS
ncbi:hypothetical protein [Burkholderia gladioli]|nr:hypothetical protein [Burkholderia gladioli]URV26585.1 hypothetical protein NAL90_09350 [Burkholderia gladioli]